MLPAALMMGGSTVLNVISSIEQGKNAYENAYKGAQELEATGDAALAAGTRAAYLSKKEGDKVLSDARAQMAASGGSASDAGAIDRLSKIKSKSEYNSLAALFEGKTARKGAYRQASRLREEGRQQLRAGRLGAVSSLLSGGSKTFDMMK